MAEDNQFIRIRIRNTSFLLPADASLGIEQREALELNSSGNGNAVAWKVVGRNRWPAYALDEDLKLTSGNAWERVVYVQGEDSAVGLAAEEVQIMTRENINAEPFTPVGPVPPSGKHVFTSAWIEGNNPILIFEPKALASLLTAIGGNA